MVLLLIMLVSVVYRASLHLHELVNCRWVDDVTQQLDTLQLQPPVNEDEKDKYDCY